VVATDEEEVHDSSSIAGDYIEGVVAHLSLWPRFQVGSASSLAPWPLGCPFLFCLPPRHHRTGQWQQIVAEANDFMAYASLQA
jgi:hypothetical protein